MTAKAKFNKTSINKNIKKAARHHIDSFSYAMTTCLERAWINMLPFYYTPPEEVKNAGFKRIILWYDSFELGTPITDEFLENVSNQNIEKMDSCVFVNIILN